MAEQRLDRRQIIKGAGTLSALGVLAAWTAPLATQADGRRHDAEEAPWTYTISIDSIANDTNWIAFYGCGTITPPQVEGGGAFVHFDHSTPKPRAIRASGTWKARELLGFAPLGAFGVLVAGVLKMQVDLIALEGTLVPPGEEQVRIPASVQVVVNVHNGGLVLQRYLARITPGDRQTRGDPTAKLSGCTPASRSLASLRRQVTL